MRSLHLGLILATAAAPAMAAPVCSVHSDAQATPLVELYTSEGCSSCPPADRWFSQHIGDKDANWLAFHVDYWDSIGWPDRFGSPAWSQRQRARVASTGDTTVYTPQVMVGTQVRASWRNGLASELHKARVPALAALTLHAQADGDGWRFSLGAARTPATDAGQAQVWLAQYSDAQVTEVHAGENRGVTLHHDRVVRRLLGPWPLGNAALSTSSQLQAPSARWGVVAFVQDAQGHVWQSLALPMPGCTG